MLYARLSDRLFATPGEWNLLHCPNPACGLIWLDPMPLEEDLGKAYAKYFTHEVPLTLPKRPPNLLRRTYGLVQSAYLAHRFNYGEHTGKRFQWLISLPITLSRVECDGLDIPLRYLTGSYGARMLDVGCGNGSVVRTAQQLGWDAEGVDFDPVAVEAAQQRGLNVHSGRLEERNYPDNSFDLILMNHVIEHIYDPLCTLGTIRRILRPGGMLVVTTPNSSGSGHHHFRSNWVHLDPPRHLRLFNHTNLCALIKRAGLRPTKIRSSIRITQQSFVASRSIRRTGRGYESRWPALLAELYGRAGAAIQLLTRAWQPLAADELLVEARK